MRFFTVLFAGLLIAAAVVLLWLLNRGRGGL
jgi:hypothetical protein